MINTTYVKKEHFLECNKLIYKYYFTPFITIYEILMALFVLFLIYLEKYIFMSVFIVIMIGFPFLIELLSRRKIKQTVDVLFKKEDDGFIYDYDFNENSFKVKIIYKDKSKEYNFKNNKVKRIIENDDSIYIFVDRETCFYVSKLGFEKYDKLTFQSYFSLKIKKYEVNKWQSYSI